MKKGFKGASFEGKRKRLVLGWVVQSEEQSENVKRSSREKCKDFFLSGKIIEINFTAIIKLGTTPLIFETKKY